MRYSILGFNQERVLSLTVITTESNGREVVLSLDTNDLLILNLIADFPNRTSVKKIMKDDKVFFWASYDEILEELPILGIKKQALSNRFDKLEKMHLVEREYIAVDAKHQNSTFFCLTNTYESLLYEAGGYRSQIRDGIVVKYDTPINNNYLDNNTEDNNKKETDTKVSSKKGFSLDMSKVSKEFVHVVEKWIEYKKERKQSYKQAGFNVCYNNLVKMSGNNPSVADLIVEQSMQNNWSGLFPLKNELTASNTQPQKQAATQREEILLKRFYDTLGDEEAEIYGIDSYAWHMLTPQQKDWHRKQPAKRERLLAWIREHDEQ